MSTETTVNDAVTEFRMPSLGADMEDGIVTEWLVDPGDPVHRGQVIAVVETDKSDIEVEIFLDGTVAELLVPEGERVEVGTPIARIAGIGAAVGSPTHAAAAAAERPSGGEPPTAADPERTPATGPTPSTEPSRPAAPVEPTSTASEDRPAARAISSPLVRHLAEDLHVDIAELHGSGPGGRIMRRDVEDARNRPGEPARRRPVVTPRARLLAERHGLDLDALAALADARRAPDGSPLAGPLTGDEVLAAVARSTERSTSKSGDAAPARRPTDRAERTRRAIANLMATSWATIPHYHVASRLDVTPALDRLAAWNDDHGVRERILPAALWLHAVARAAAAVPALNGWWVDDEFRPAEHVDLGVVVARRGGGIVVPTIAHADELSVPEIMTALADIVARVRANKLRSSDAIDASITVTNLGDLGADAVYGVIHPPQVALVGIGRVHEAPWVDDGELTVRSVLDVTVAADHRATDGLVGATFLSKLAGIIGDLRLEPQPDAANGETHEDRRARIIETTRTGEDAP